jgi:hypothetical protein
VSVIDLKPYRDASEPPVIAREPDATLPAQLVKLDERRRDERCVQDQIAEILSGHLYGKHYDELPADARIAVEGAAMRAIRAVQPAWRRVALERARTALSDALRAEMGRDFAGYSDNRREALAIIGARAVLSAQIGIYEVADPFDGPGEALRIYRATEESRQ